MERREKIKKWLLKGVLNLLDKSGALEKIGNSVKRNLPGIVSISEFSPLLTARLSDLTTQGMVPLVVIGHFNHLDPIVASNLCQTLINKAQREGVGENLQGFVATIAKSVPAGHQSRLMEKMYPKANTYAAERGVELFPVTREKDKKYNMVKDHHTEIFSLARKIRRKGIGVVILPGGTVQAGRHPEGATKDQINGLQEVTDSDLVDMFNIMEKLGRSFGQRPFYLPVGINRTYRMFSADSLWPTPEGIISLSGKLSKALKLFGFERIIVGINVGMPITEEDMAEKLGNDWKKDPSIVNQFLMKQVAGLLPPHARGFYSSPTS
jgi:hypothetical protein